MQGTALTYYKGQFPSCSGDKRMDGNVTQALSDQVKQQWPEPKGVDDIVSSGLLLPLPFTS